MTEQTKGDLPRSEDPSPPHARAIQDALRRIVALAQSGALDAAADACERLRLLCPDDPNVLACLAEIHWNKGRRDRARELIATGLQGNPDHAPLHLLMGKIAGSEEDLGVALHHFREVVRLKPDHVEGHFQCGIILLVRGLHAEGGTSPSASEVSAALRHFQEVVRLDPGHIGGHFQLGATLAALGRHLEATAALRRCLDLKPGFADGHRLLANACDQLGWKALADVHLRLHDHFRRPNTPPLHVTEEVKDTCFLDGKRALAAARSGLKFKIHQHFPARQICYHSRWELADAGLETLIHCPPERLEAFFHETRLRLPTAVDFDPTDAGQRGEAQTIAGMIDAVPHLQVGAIQTPLELGSKQKPDFVADRPWRIFAATSRWTTVLQYATRGLADALERRGCRVTVSMENNDLEMLKGYHYLRERLACNPHITLNINRMGIGTLHPDVFNVVWYQDPVAELREGKPLPWRARDIVFSAYPDFDDMIRRTGIEQVRRQDLCVDTTCFHETRPRQERRKVVFIGSAHHRLLRGLPGEQVLLHELGLLVEQGAVITPGDVQEMALRQGLDLVYVTQYLYPYVVRNRAVAWLCELAPELAWEVEIYGRFWEDIPAIAPYFRGEIPHGAAVAAVYNQARYALDAHPGKVKSQRLAEMAACGCIPLLFDDRLHAEGPLWEDEILFFKTREALRDCLRREPKNDPATIARAYTYDAFAERILQLVAEGRGDYRIPPE
ncbi:MAG: tetratricopeptide repeat protein [Magnetococcales bacterium]|nr:tetratricopeptide repeat protein [Magnetococcales bacterium]